MLGPVILAASRSDRMRRLVSAAPVTQQVVDRFIAGETVDDVVPIVRGRSPRSGLERHARHVGEDITDPRARPAPPATPTWRCSSRLARAGARRARRDVRQAVDVRPGAADGGHELALANVRPVVEAAAAIGTTVTLDMEDHTTLDSTFAILDELRKDFPRTGASSRPTSSAPRTTPAASPRPAAGCGW